MLLDFDKENSKRRNKSLYYHSLNLLHISMKTYERASNELVKTGLDNARQILFLIRIQSIIIKSFI